MRCGALLSAWRRDARPSTSDGRVGHPWIMLDGQGGFACPARQVVAKGIILGCTFDYLFCVFACESFVSLLKISSTQD
jgi:hypothetical protein